MVRGEGFSQEGQSLLALNPRRPTPQDPKSCSFDLSSGSLNIDHKARISPLFFWDGVYIPKFCLENWCSDREFPRERPSFLFFEPGFPSPDKCLVSTARKAVMLGLATPSEQSSLRRLQFTKYLQHKNAQF